VSSLPTISVIVAAYNYAHYLSKAINSILTQDYPADLVEIIVVDDGSTDDTPKVIERFGDRIIAISQANAGQPAATEQGLRVAGGELLTLLDADDWWKRDRLRVMATAMARHPEAGLIYGDLTVVDDHNRVVARSFRQDGRIQARSGHVMGELMIDNFITGGGLMVRAEHREAMLPFPSEVAYQDWWMATAVARSAPVQAIHDSVCCYRAHGSNANLNADVARKLKLLRSDLPFRRWLLLNVDLGPGVTEEHFLRALQLIDRIRAFIASYGEPNPLEADRDAAIAALHRASDHLDAADVAAARVELVRAAIHDLDYAVPRQLLAELDAVLIAA
jgi:glycosyltransferase involved in cell wall biosynthesis